jgi:hypothetical protein
VQVFDLCMGVNFVVMIKHVDVFVVWKSFKVVVETKLI